MHLFLTGFDIGTNGYKKLRGRWLKINIIESIFNGFTDVVTCLSKVSEIASHRIEKVSMFRFSPRRTTTELSYERYREYLDCVYCFFDNL